MGTRLLTIIGAALALIGVPMMGAAVAQDEPTKSEMPAGPRGRPGRPATKGSVRPYDDVITSEAKSDPGLFLIHRLDDRVFYEIPTSLLGKPMLWVTQIERSQSGFGNGGSPVGDRVVRWELRGDEILLRDVR